MLEIDLYSLIVLILIIAFTSLYIYIKILSNKKNQEVVNILNLKFTFLKEMTKIRFKNVFYNDLDADEETKKEMFFDYMADEKKELTEYLLNKYQNTSKKTIENILKNLYK